MQDRLVHRQVGALDLQIPTEECRAILLQPGKDTGIDHADRGDRGNTQGEAGQKHEKAGKPASQFAPSKAPGKRQPCHHATSFSTASRSRSAG